MSDSGPETSGPLANAETVAGARRKRTVFLDNWAIQRLLDQDRIRELFLPGGAAGFRAVVSLWHLYEIAGDGNAQRVRRKAALLDELAPLWIKVVVQLREETLRAHLWSYLRFKPTVEAVRPFSENLTQATEVINGERSPVALTAVKHMEYLKRYPELLDDARRGTRDWARATRVIMRRKTESLARVDEVVRKLLRRQLPTQTPTGCEIPASELDRFITQLNWREVPLLALEGALYQAELSWPSDLDEGDAVDIQYLSVALLNCDAVVVDKRMAELTRRAMSKQNFSVATVLRDPTQLLAI